MPATIVTRFAPSPTGRLHLGHAHSALLGWRTARAAGGLFLLRLEDIDPVRCRPDYAAGILEDLAWLGLDWDGPVRIQSEHLPEYRATLDRLEGMGLLYPCFCTRADIAREVAAIGHAPHGPDGLLYPGTCRRLSAAERLERRASGAPYALRLDMAAALRRVTGPLSFLEVGEGRIRCEPARFGDVVLARKDTPASYHLCVSHDDAIQGVTLVTRAEDLRRPPTCTACCRRCSAGPPRATGTTGCCWDRMASGSPNGQRPDPGSPARGRPQPGRGAGDGRMAGNVEERRPGEGIPPDPRLSSFVCWREARLRRGRRCPRSGRCHPRRDRSRTAPRSASAE